ncbi:type I-E CRISPR-associated endoribonuclease Cas2e, partial [Salmonella enterica subsp. enterica serovar Typhimurium]|uniref:type I-E CRISPR-associated endoribonuclease Cas2e n=1 Tax=Salmonella enterica TaxID=28901 RepID=UPI0020A5EE4C
MSMTVVVTRNISSRVRGFLASAMLELAPGVYSAPRISPAVRDRVWDVLKDWFPNERDASLIMIWQE